MVDTGTQQFMYRAFVGLVCAVVLLVFVYMIAVGLQQGDGEAIRVIEALSPIAITVFLSAAGVLGLHTVTNGSVARATINSSAPAPVSVPAPAVGLVASSAPAPVSDL